MSGELPLYIRAIERKQLAFAVTSDVWDHIAAQLIVLPPICFQKYPDVYPIIYWAWQLQKRRMLHGFDMSTVVSMYADQALFLNLICWGLLGGRLCGCYSCTTYSFEDPNGR